MAKFLNGSIIWKLVLPVPLLLLISIGIAWFIIPKLIIDNSKTSAVNAAVQTANQFKTIRGYYTKNVIKKVVKNGTIKPSFNHASEANSIPLPATFIHDLSELLKKNNVTVNLFSAFPFSNRSDRTLDGFQKTAWDYLSKNPDQVYTKNEKRNGKSIIRVAIADKMVAKACVNCHNSHAASPKTDWKMGDVRGVLEVDADISKEIAAATSVKNKLLLGAVLISLLLAAISFIAVNRIIDPLKKMTSTMRQLAKGQDEIDVPAQNRDDEIGEMASAVQVFKENAAERKQLRQENQKQLLGRRERQEKMEHLITDFRSQVQKLLQIVNSHTDEMENAAHNLSAMTVQTSTQATCVAAASDRASKNVHLVSEATKELTTSINEISSQISMTTSDVSKASDSANETDRKVGNLSNSAEKIGDVIALIQEISEQTNLLALNATIEAARAGDAGKGFAVVAAEVKELATQTGKATGDISAQIENIQNETSSAVEAIRGISGTMRDVSSATQAIASAVEEQSASTSEISENIHQAVLGTKEVAENISGVTEAAEANNKSAEQVFDVSKNVSEKADELLKVINEFLDDVEAA